LRRRNLLAVSCLGALAIAVPLAVASHQFTDVPNGHPFHADIGAIKDAGITGGKTCDVPGTPPTYCPTEPITREAMAAFVHRGNGRAGYDSGPDLAIGANAVDLETLQLQIGGTAGNTQFVKVDAVVTTYVSSLVGCPCDTQYWIELDGVGPVSDNRYQTNSALGSIGFGYETGAVTAVAAVPTATTQTFRVKAIRFGLTTGTVRGWGSLSAITAAFGSTGGNTLVAP
jgi:hypothetical protein